MSPYVDDSWLFAAYAICRRVTVQGDAMFLTLLSPRKKHDAFFNRDVVSNMPITVSLDLPLTLIFLIVLYGL